jgi:ketosteroid isomerase-like protein
MNIPPSVSAYFAADSHADPDALAAAFAEGAVVLDEGGRHQGREAIRKWWIAAKEASQHVTEPVAATTEGDVVAVRAIVSGTFPGSPVTLLFRFTIESDEIIRLEIT